MNSPSYRYWLGVLALFSLISCSEKSAENDLALVSKEADRHTRGATIARGDYVETLRDLYPEEVGQIASEIETHIRFRKWVCKAGGKRKICKGENAVPIDYLIRSAVVDPLSIEIAAPESDSGETGFAVQFRCASSSAQDCVIFQRIGGVGVNYDRCEKRDCAADEAEWETEVKDLAQARSEEDVEWIPCRSEKACEKAAAAFRDMIALASGRPLIRDEKAFRRAVAEIREVVVSATSRQRFNRENNFTFSTGSFKARDIVYRTDEFRLDDDGRIHLAVSACARDKEGGCENDANWQTEVAHFDVADLEPVLIGVDDQSGNEIAEDAAFGRNGILVGGPCRDKEKCVNALGGNRSGDRLSMPCREIAACRAADKKLEALSIFAAGPDGRAMTEALRADANAVTEIKDAAHARRVAKGLARRMVDENTIADEDFFFYYTINIETSDFDAFNDLVLTGTARDCFLEDCDKAPEKDLMPVDAKIRINFRELGDGAVEVGEVSAKSEALQIGLDADSETYFAEIRLGGLVTNRRNSANIACVNAKQCNSLAADLRGLAQFTKAQEAAPPNAAEALAKFDAIIGELIKHTDGVAYFAFDEESKEFTKIQFQYIRADAEGALRIGLLACFDEKLDACDADAEWFNTVSIFSPKTLNPADVILDAFDKDGMPATDGQDTRWSYIEKEAQSFGIIALCEGEEECVDHQDLGKSTALYFPCGGEVSCKGVIDAFSRLWRFSHSPAFDAAIAAHRDRLRDGTRIQNARQARQAASRISKSLTERSFALDHLESEKFKLVQRKMRFESDATIVLDTDIEKVAAGAGQNPDPSAGETQINLRQLDRNEIRVGDPHDVTGWFLQVSCAGDQRCVDNDFYGREMLAKGWTITCEDLGQCEDAARDLRGLVDFALGGRPADDDGGGSDRRDRSAPLEADAPRKLRRPLSALNNATRNAAIYIRAAEGPSLRKLQALEASIDKDGRMTARRRVCLALLAEDRREENECRLDTLYHPYDLEIVLAELDPRNVEVADYDAGATGQGWWITAGCRKTEIACARLIVPGNPAHMRPQSETMMRSFLESERDPKIRIPCVSETDCKDAAKALRELIKAAPKPKRDRRQARQGGDIVGVWSFQSAYPTGWVIEFRKNGDYTFTMPNARIDGTYTAKNGKYSLRARQPNSDDDGTYRLLDDDTLELAGRLGVGVWRRVEDQ